MVRVSIDVEAARGVVGDLRTFFDDAMDEWSAVGNSCAQALCSTTPLKALSDPLIRISGAARDLETRIELAIAVNTGDDGGMPTSGVLSYELTGADTIENVKGALGAEIAQGLRGLDAYGHLDRSDVELFEHYTTLMEKYADDPLVTDGLFDELGPRGVVELPVLLKDFAQNYQRYATGHSPENLHWDEDTPMSSRISELQQRFLEAFGTGLGTSTHSPDFRRDNPDFAEEIVQAVKEGHGLGWGLSQVLRYGEHEAGFLTTLGTGLYEHEKGQFGPVWAPQVQNDQWAWRLGTEDDGRYYDPFVGLFEAMGRNPEAAMDFFNPDGGGEEAQERAKYLIQERTWRADDFNALGEALDAASTTFHRPDAPVHLQEQAAWIASATIHHLGQRDAGRNDRRIGDGAKDSLAHILASYIADVDRTADNNTAGRLPGTRATSGVSPWTAGLPVGAEFGRAELNAVLGETLTDDAAMEQVARAVAAWNAHRLELAVDGFNDGSTDSGRVNAALQGGAQLQGYVLGNLERASEAAGKNIDERNKQFVDLAFDVVNLVPTGKTFTSFLVDQALDAAKTKITDAVTGNEAAADAENFDAQQATLTDLQLGVAIAMGDSPHLPESARTNEHGEVYPWFADGAFDTEVLRDPAVRSVFHEWVSSGDAGELITGWQTDVGQAYDEGRERGRGR